MLQNVKKEGDVRDTEKGMQVVPGYVGPARSYKASNVAGWPEPPTVAMPCLTCTTKLNAVLVNGCIDPATLKDVMLGDRLWKTGQGRRV